MDEYNLPLGLDIEKIIQKASTVKAVLQDLNNTAQNLGQSAQQSFNNASQASVNLGRNVVQQASSFSTTTRSIENMKDALNDLKQMAFSERDTAKIRFYNQEIQKLEQQIKQTTNAGRQGFDEMGNRISSATKQTGGFIDGIKKIGSALGIAFSAQILFQFGKELYNIGVQAAGIERAFSRLGDSGSLSKLREETRGFVGDLELEKLTVKANNFNIPMEKLGGFLAFASIRAKETGEDVDKLTNNIIDGLGRKSSRIIDNLGISIVDIQKEFQKTGDFTLAVSNLIEREMQTSGIQVDTMADRVNRLGVTWENAKLSVAKYFVELLNKDVAHNDVIANLTKSGQRQLGDLTKASSASLDKIISDQEKVVKRLSDNAVKAGKAYSDARGNIFSPSGFEALFKRTAEEELAASQNILRNLKDQNIERQKAERIAKGVLSVVEMEQKVSDLRQNAKNILPGVSGTAEQRSKLLKEADDLQKQIDEITGKSQKKREKSDEQAESKRLARLKALNSERVRLENDFNNAQIEAIEDVTTRAVAAETVGSQNKVRELENRKKEFPELTRQINSLIEEEERQSKARVLLIIKKGEEDELKTRKASQQEIARVLKEDTEVQIDAINDRYDLIRQNAKKAGTLTADIEKSLAVQQTKEVTDVTIKAQDESLKKQQEVALSGILVRKRRESETEKAFERQNQEDILKIQIEFSEQRLKLIENDPAKVKEANELRKAIQDAQNAIDKMSKTKSVDLLDLLGINGDKLKSISDAVSEVGSIASDLFGALAEGAQQRVDEIQEQIDAIDELISAQEEAVNKEKDLMDKGYANNYDNAQRGLQAQKAQRDELLKQQQEAQKQQQDLQRAQIIADGISQASNLITASTDIFKVFAKIPFIGVPLAIAAIATMFGAFTIAKVNAFNSTKLAEGGTIGGKSHAEGGNKYVSLDGQSFMEHERGEEVTRKSSAEKHRKLLKAINADDFSGLSMFDASIQDLLKGTGVYTQIENAKESSMNNVGMVDASRTVVINGSSKSESYLEKIEKRLASMEKQNQAKSTVMDMGDYYIIKTGNHTQKIWKK